MTSNNMSIDKHITEIPMQIFFFQSQLKFFPPALENKGALQGSYHLKCNARQTGVLMPGIA